MASLTHRQLALTFDLGTGSFGESGYNRLRLGGNLRASAKITEAGGPAFGQLELTVSGMTDSHMNQLSTLGLLYQMQRRNVVTVEAGDNVNGMSTVYQGTIRDAWSDFTGAPNNVFHVTAFAGHINAVKPIPPSSFPGVADVATILRGLATQAGYIFQNNGVSTQLVDAYYPGTIGDQIKACAEHAHISHWINNGTLFIWPKGGARNDLIPIVSPATGLSGYPTFASSQIQLRTLFNPSIGFGQQIKVESSLTPANKIWQINFISHILESETPNGQWHTVLTAAPPGQVIISR